MEFSPCPKPPRRVKVRKCFGAARKPLRNRPVSKMFAKRRVPGYKEWIVTFDCLIVGKHVCAGRIECHHVQTRKSGGDDIGNCVPLCKLAHQQWGVWGPVSWQRKYDTDARIAAIQLGRMYQRDIAPCP